MVGFGQLVIGPPGSGKTRTQAQRYFQLTSRPCAVVNLEREPRARYECAVSTGGPAPRRRTSSASSSSAPTAGWCTAAEYLVENLAPRSASSLWWRMIDGSSGLPGQVELFNTHPPWKRSVDEIARWILRVCTVHLVDSHLCADQAKYVAALMLSLSSMLHLETPHVNVLSKVDPGTKVRPPDFNLEYYADVQDLTSSPTASRISGRRRGVHVRRHAWDERYCARSTASWTRPSELVEDFRSVNFTLLRIEDKERPSAGRVHHGQVRPYVTSGRRGIAEPPRAAAGRARGSTRSRARTTNARASRRPRRRSTSATSTSRSVSSETKTRRTRGVL